MERLEVRCCCQPQKLLGWMNVPHAERGRYVVAKRRTMTNLSFSQYWAQAPRVRSEEKALPLDVYSAPGEAPRLAVKAEGLELPHLVEWFGPAPFCFEANTVTDSRPVIQGFQPLRAMSVEDYLNGG